LDPHRVGYLTHGATEGIHFPHQVPFRDASNSRIAGHLSHQVEIHGNHGGFQTEPGTCPRRLAASMPSADHDRIVLPRH